MRTRLLFFLSFFTAILANAQAVVDMSFVQNPLFQVSTNDVTASLDKGPLSLGADIVITGGSGTYSYRWYNAEGTIDSSSTLVVTTPGEYFLDVADQCDCLQTIAFHITGQIPEGINTLRAAEAISYDSASSTLSFSSEAAIYQVCIVSTSGRLVGVTTSYEGPITFLPLASTLHTPGVYIVQAVQPDGNILTKTIIKK